MSADDIFRELHLGSKKPSEEELLNQILGKQAKPTQPKPETKKTETPVARQTPATDKVAQPVVKTSPEVVSATPVVEKVAVKPIVEPKKEEIKPVQQKVADPQVKQAPTEPKQTVVAEVEDQTVQHPPIRRSVQKKEPEFKNLSARDKLLYKDLFVKDGGSIKYNASYQKTVAKNLSKGIMDEVVDDLRTKHRNVEVWIGENPFLIKETNDVFLSPTSTMRFLLLDQLRDENTALQVARQLFLEKHPRGEKKGFNHNLVRTDERDVYAVLLASKTDPQKDLAEQVKELLFHVQQLKTTSYLADKKLLDQSNEADQKLSGLSMAMSLVILERLGLTNGSIPKELKDIKTFMAQEPVFALSDVIEKDVGVIAKRRHETITRDQRTRTPRQRPVDRGQGR